MQKNKNRAENFSVTDPINCCFCETNVYRNLCLVEKLEIYGRCVSKIADVIAGEW